MTKITIQKAGKEVTLYGIQHSSSLNQIEFLRKELNFTCPQLVFVEGGFNLVTFDSEKDAIGSGEMGFVSYYCKKNNIEIMSNDPSNKECYELISNKYGEKIAYLYFALRDYSTNSNHLKMNLEKVKTSYREIFGRTFRAHDEYIDYFDPTKNLNLFNEITRVLNKFRDNFMLMKLKEQLKHKNKIVIIKGDYHIRTMAKHIIEIVIDERG
jgi:hypothetical protein|tara:strand:+ start:111 stop:743 length:633 start_codon:yes stop_codon:yes gene_type:complete